MHRPISLRLVVLMAIAAAAVVAPAAQNLTLPNAKRRAEDSPSSATAAPAIRRSSRWRRSSSRARDQFPYELVLMMGDNLLQRQRAEGLREEVRDAVQAAARLGDEVLRDARQPRQPERALLQAVQHERRAVLHVQAEGRTSASSPSTATTSTSRSSEWLEKELAASGSDWKVCFFHHPLYSSGGTHGSDTQLRERLEPLFLKYGVDAVLRRPRTLLRAHQTAEGHLLLRLRRRREGAQGRRRARPT